MTVNGEAISPVGILVILVVAALVVAAIAAFFGSWRR